MSDVIGPDLRPYNDLVLFDRDAQQIFDAALVLAKARLPDWIEREGNTEVVILEGQALEVSELTFAINRLPAAVVLVLLELFEIVPDFGAQPEATARFTFIDAGEYTVPAGTRLTWSAGPFDRAYVVRTTDNLILPAGATTTTIGVIGDDPGTALHSANVGDALALSDVVLFVEGVEFETKPAGGREPETTSEFLTRGIQKLRTLTTTLVKPSHFEAATLLYPAVERVKALDNYDATQAGAPGAYPGHISVAVYGPDGTPVSTADKALIEIGLEDKAIALLDVHVYDATVTGVNLRVTLETAKDYDQAVIRANVLAILDDYLNPATWPWGTTVYGNEIISLLDSVPGVVRVMGAVSFPRNLMTANGASVETSVAEYVAGANTTAAQDGTHAAHGTKSLKLTATGAGTLRASKAAANGFAATVGDTYSLLGFFMPNGVTARNVRVGVSWYTAGAALISTVWGNPVSCVAGAWTQAHYTGVAPATAATGRIELEVQGVVGAEIWYADKFDVHNGDGLVWQPGGQPVDVGAGAEPHVPLEGYAPLADFGGIVLTLVAQP